MYLEPNGTPWPDFFGYGTFVAGVVAGDMSGCG